MITVDASLLIAHLDPADPHHPQATRLLLAFAAESLLVHALNLAEALVGGVRAGRGAQLLRELEAAGIRVATPDQLEALRLAELRASTGLKLPDCCALDTAMSHGTRLATFDSRLSRVARDLTVEVVP